MTLVQNANENIPRSSTCFSAIVRAVSIRQRITVGEWGSMMVKDVTKFHKSHVGVGVYLNVCVCVRVCAGFQKRL